MGLIKLKIVHLLLVICLLASCDNKDKTTHEEITKLALPEKSEVVESYDDGKFVHTISLQVEGAVLQDYVKQHDFQAFDQMQIPKFWSANNLKETKPDFSDLQGFYYTSGVSGARSWIYIADLKSNRLWAEIKQQQKAY